MKLPDGTYKLARNVTNPDRNLRNKRDWTCFEKWEEGDVFFLRTIINHGTKDGRSELDSWQELQLKGHTRTLPEHENAFALILMASDRIEETPSLYLQRVRRDDQALQILDQMFRNRDITIKLVADCLSDIDTQESF